MAGPRKLSELFYEIRARTEFLQRDLQDTERQFGKLSSFILKNPVAALGAVGTAAAGVAIAATKMAAQVDASLQKVAAAVPAGAEGFGALRQEIERLSVATGKTQDDLAQAAATIAKTGAGSSEEVAQRLKAVVAASQASGTELNEVIAGLDQTLDLFGLSSADASAAVAELFSVARGKSSLTDLFAQLQAAAPGIQRLGLDLPTAARALVQLGESGLSAKQAASELKRLAEGGSQGRAEIVRLAEEIPKAADPMRDLADAADRVNESTANVGPRLKAELNAALITLGNEILPVANEGLQSLLNLVQQLRGGSTKNLQNAFGTILVDGPRILKSLELGAADAVLDQQTSGRFDALKRSIEQLAQAASEGRIDLQQFGEAGLQQLAVQIARFSQTRIFTGEQQQELQTFLQQITAAQVELAKSRASAGRVGTTGARPAVSQVDFKAQEKDAKQAAAAMADVEAAFTALFEKASAGKLSVADFQEEVAKLGDTFREKVTKPTDDQAASFRLLSEAASHVQALLQNFTAEEAEKELQSLKAALTPSVIDDVRVAYQQFADALRQKGFSDEAIAPLLALKAALGDVAVGMEQLDGRIERVKETAISAFDAQLGLTVLLREAEEQLRQLETSDLAIAGNEAAAVRIAGLREQVRKLKEELAALSGQAQRKGSDDTTHQASLSRAQQLGRAIEDVGRLTLAAADAFDVMSDKAVKALAASIDVAAGVGRIILGDSSGGTAQLASGVVSLLGQIFGKDPAADQRRREHAENLEALRAIQRNTGDLLGLTQSGRDIAGIRGAVGDLLALTGDAGGHRRFGDAGPLRSINEASFLSAQTGLSFKEIEALAKSLGITLNGTKQSYLDFLAALKQLDLEAYTRGFTGQLRKLEIEARLDPTAFVGLDGLMKRIALLTGPDGAPALAKALEGLDLTTEEGRVAAIASLGDVLRNLSSLDVADLGGLSLDQFIEQILGVIDQLRQVETPMQAATEKFNAALDAFGVAMELGSLTAEQRLAKVSALFKDLFPDLAASIDTTSLDTVKASIQRLIDGFAEDGDLTEAEQAQIAVLRLLMDAFSSASSEADTLAQKAQAAMAEARALVFALADAILAVNDIVDPVEILRVKAAALVQAFPELAETMAQFDLSTQAGRDALEAWIQSLIASPDGLKEMADKMGITVEELVAQLLGLERAADAAATKVATLAEQLASAFDDVQFQLDLEGVTDPLEQLKRTVGGIAGLIPEIDQALAGIDLSTVEGRKLAEQQLVALGKTTTDAAVRNAILKLLGMLRGLAPAADTGEAAGDVAGAGAGTTTAQSGVQQITERTGLLITELQRLNNRQNEAIIALLARIAGEAVPVLNGAAGQAPAFSVRSAFPALDPSQLLRPPALAGPVNTVTQAAPVVSVRIQNTFTGPITAGDAASVEAGIESSVRAGLNKAFGTELADIRTFRGGWPT